MTRRMKTRSATAASRRTSVCQEPTDRRRTRAISQNPLFPYDRMGHRVRQTGHGISSSDPRSLREAQGFPNDKWPATADQRFLAERERVRR
jgi:hypothetical protein